MNLYGRTIKRSEIEYEFLKSISGVIDLTPGELIIMAELIRFDKAWKPKLRGEPKNVLTEEVRHYLMNKYLLATSFISKTKKNLIKKGALIETDIDCHLVNPILIPDIIGDRVQLVILLKITEDDDRQETRPSGEQVVE